MGHNRKEFDMDIRMSQHEFQTVGHLDLQALVATSTSFCVVDPGPPEVLHWIKGAPDNIVTDMGRWVDDGLRSSNPAVVKIAQPTNGPHDPTIKHSEQWAKVITRYYVEVQTVGMVDYREKILKELRLQFGAAIVNVWVDE